MKNLTDIYEKCVHYGAILPTEVDSIVKRYGCYTEITNANWEGLSIDVYTDSTQQELLGNISFDWYFSGTISFYDPDYVLLHEYNPLKDRKGLFVSNS